MTYISSATLRRTKKNIMVDDAAFNTAVDLDNDPLCIKRQADGKILVGGYFTKYGNSRRYYIMRLNADYSLDTSFGNSVSGLNGQVTQIDIQSTGKIIVGGNFTKFGSTTVSGMVRLNSDGTLDAAFGYTSYVIKVDSSDRIYVANSDSVRRYNSNLTVDSTFTATDLSNISTIRGIDIQSDGKVLVCGDVRITEFEPEIIDYTVGHLSRLNANGGLDSTFTNGLITATPDTGTNNYINGVKQMSDGKILIWGAAFYDVHGSPSPSECLLKLNSSGSTIDGSFSPGIYSSGYGGGLGSVNVEFRSDGKMLVLNASPSFGNSCIVNADGTVVSPYTDYMPIAYSSCLLDSDKVIIGTYSGLKLNVFNSAGVNLNIWSSGPNGYVKTIHRLSDGTYFVLGSFTQFDGVQNKGLVKLDQNGFYISQVNISFLPSYSGVNVMTVDEPNQKIYLGGDFSVSGLGGKDITCVDFSGTIVALYGATAGSNGAVNAIKLRPDGKIVVGGTFTTFNGISTQRLVILNSDGTIYSVISGIDNTVTAIEVQSDNKILVCGSFTGRIKRFNADGTSDATFSCTANSTIVGMLALTDGRILLTGQFTTINSTIRNSVCMVSSTGTVDTSFVPPSTVNGASFAVTDSDGGFFISGFAYVGGSGTRWFKLRADGKLDASFFDDMGSSPSCIINEVNKIVLAGSFDTSTKSRGNYLKRLLRITN